MLAPHDVGGVFYMRNEAPAEILSYDETNDLFLGEDCVWTRDGKVYASEPDAEHAKDLVLRKQIPVWRVMIASYAPTHGQHVEDSMYFGEQLAAHRFRRKFVEHYKDKRPYGNGSFYTCEVHGHFAAATAKTLDADAQLDFIQKWVS